MGWTERHAFQSVGESDHTWEIDKSSLRFYPSISYLGSCEHTPKRDAVAKICILRLQPASEALDLGILTESCLWLLLTDSRKLGGLKQWFTLLPFRRSEVWHPFHCTEPKVSSESCSLGGSKEESVSSPFPASGAPFVACLDSWPLSPSSKPAGQLPDSVVTSPYTSVINFPLPPSY